MSYQRCCTCQSEHEEDDLNICGECGTGYCHECSRDSRKLACKCGAVQRYAASSDIQEFHSQTVSLN
jgi:hypothetical protein